MMNKFKFVSTIVVALLAILSFSDVLKAEKLYIRDGWDIINNVADSSGYSGTKDDTALASSYGVYNPGPLAGASELILRKINEQPASIIDFDLSGISQLANVDIISAKLKVTFSFARWFKGGTFDIREADKAWIEDVPNYWRCNASGELWNNWSDGMKMEGPTLDAVTVPANNTLEGQVGTEMEFDVSSLIEDWVENGSLQTGFALVYTSGSLDNDVYIAGKDYAIVEYRPMLEIEYVPIPCSTKKLYIRDGWDIIDNVADSSGYSGTKDDTALASSYGVYNPGPLAGASELILRQVNEQAVSIIDFDLSDISQLANSDVISAKLKVTFSGAQWFKGGTFDVREADKAWVEDVPNYWRCNASGELWNNWSDGMKMEGPTLDAVTVPANNTLEGQVGTEMEFDVSSLIEGWVENGSLQTGFALVYTSGSLDNDVYIAGKDYAIVEYRPMLEIKYAPMPPMADLTNDCFVDIEDLAVLASQWQTNP